MDADRNPVTEGGRALAGYPAGDNAKPAPGGRASLVERVADVVDAAPDGPDHSPDGRFGTPEAGFEPDGPTPDDKRGVAGLENGGEEERPDRALAALLASPKYRGIFPGAVKRVYAEQLKRHGPKGAEKAARTELHRIAGAFLTPGELKKARACLDMARRGDEGALFKALSLHASTRERLPEIDAFYERALGALGGPAVVADLACGLNPLYLGRLGLRVRGIELHEDAARLVNDWAGAMGWDVRAEPGDLAGDVSLPEADATLLMKLLPLLEGQLPGGSMALLSRVRSPKALVYLVCRWMNFKLKWPIGIQMQP